MKIIKFTSNVVKNNTNNKKFISFNNISTDFFHYLKKSNFKKFFKFKIDLNSKSLFRVLKNNNLNNVLNVIFKKGKKLSVLKNLNKFNDEFYFYIQNNQNNDFYNLIFDKKHLFKFENLIPFLFNNLEIMFDIKKKPEVKNLKKIKRKPKKNQIIYIKKQKRLPFIIKYLSIQTKKGKSKFFFINFLNFILDNILINKSSIITKKKNYIYSKTLKYLKKKD